MFDVEACVAELRALAREDRSGWAASARAARVTELAALREAADAALVAALADLDRDRGWAADGAATAHAWLAGHGGLGPADAARTVASARLVGAHDQVRDALVDGAVTTGHVALLARAGRDHPTLLARDVGVLVDAARRLDHARFRAVTRRWAVLADDHEGPPPRPAHGLHTSITFAGRVRLDAELEPDDGATVLAAIAAHLAPPRADDPRTPAQRRAAALVDAVTRRRTVTLDVVVDAHTLGGRPPADPGAARHDVGPVGPVPPTVLARLACDATTRTVVVDADGTPGGVGPATRLVPVAMRRLLDHRDQGCTWPGCDRPPDWCDAHHVVPWARGGPTQPDNLRLLCRHHHRLAHQHDAPAAARPP